MDWNWAFAEQKRLGWAMVRAAMWLMLAMTHLYFCAKESPTTISLAGCIAAVDVAILWMNLSAKHRSFEEFCESVVAQMEAVDA